MSSFPPPNSDDPSPPLEVPRVPRERLGRLDFQRVCNMYRYVKDIHMSSSISTTRTVSTHTCSPQQFFRAHPPPHPFPQPRLPITSLCSLHWHHGNHLWEREFEKPCAEVTGPGWFLGCSGSSLLEFNLESLQFFLL